MDHIHVLVRHLPRQLTAAPKKIWARVPTGAWAAWVSIPGVWTRAHPRVEGSDLPAAASTLVRAVQMPSTMLAVYIESNKTVYVKHAGRKTPKSTFFWAKFFYWPIVCALTGAFQRALVRPLEIKTR